MNNLKISEMAEAESLNDNDLLTIVQGGINKKITKQKAIGNIIQAINNPTYTTTEGTDLSIDNTRVGKMKFEYYGNIEQETTTGKNKMKTINTQQTVNGITFTPVYNNGLIEYINVNGTATDNTMYPLGHIGTDVIFDDTLPAGSYLLTDEVGNYTDYFTQFTDGTTFINTGVGSAFTLSEQKNVRSIIYVRSGKTVNNLHFKPMIRLASVTDATFEPYTGGIASPNPDYPQEVKTVTGENTITIQNEDETQSQSYEINLGTNYFDKTNITSCVNGSIINDAIVSTALSTNYAGVSANIGSTSLDAGSYYLSCKVKVVSGTSSTTLNTIAITGSPSITVTWKDRPNLTNKYQTFSVSFTLSQKTSITNILVQLSTGNTNAILNVADIMISKTITKFVPYFDPIELCKLGDYQDYIYYKNGKWFKHKEVGKIILNGSQNITQAGSGTRRFNANYTTLGLTNVKEGTNTEETTATLRKCDHFLPPEGQSTWGRYYMYNSWLVFFDTESVIADATALASWFTNNNTIIYYVLATPEDIEITEPTLINQLNAIKYGAESYYGQTNIMITSEELRPTLKVQTLDKIGV